MGAGQGRMTTHSHKKFESADLIGFRDRFDLPLSDEQATSLSFYKPADDSLEMRYLRAHRAALGGALPRRETACDVVPVPALPAYARFALEADGKDMSTTMAFVRMLGNLLKDAALGPRIVPIVADEARTFGMANLFKQVGIYSSVGQRYAPEDIDSILSYREATDGQMQTFAAKDGRFNRDTFFGQNEELRQLAQGMTDEQIDRLKRGGHDIVKIHAAYAAAAAHSGQPTVILAHTK